MQDYHNYPKYQMEATEGTINDLMIRSQFDSHTHTCRWQDQTAACRSQGATSHCRLTHKRSREETNFLRASVQATPTQMLVAACFHFASQRNEAKQQTLWGIFLAPWWQTVGFTVCAVAYSEPISRASNQTKTSRKRETK